MKEFKKQEYRDNLTKTLKSIPDHAERKELTDSIKETRIHKAAQKKEKGPSFEIIATFALPDQTKELDFKRLLQQPLFNKNYYLFADQQFQKLVLEPSVPFNDTQGKEYQEARILKEERDEVVMRDLGVDPISLNEWRYLFSQLTEEQLSGETTFYVTFDDEKIYALRTLFSKDGEGPYQYSVEIENLSDETYPILENTKVISPRKK